MKIILDQQQCQRVAEFIKTLDLPVAQEDAFAFSIPSELMANTSLALVAICHQTTPHNQTRLHGYIDGQLRWAWDYLREKWLRTVEKNHGLVSPQSLAKISAQDIEAIFFDSQVGSTIYNSAGRAEILNQLGREMIDLGVENVELFYKITGGILVSRDRCRGLLDMLEQLSFLRADPVRKKLFWFLSLMSSQKLWQYPDPEKLGVPAEYHEVRLHLRLQTIKVVDSDLKDKLGKRLEVSVEDDIEIRYGVFEAIMLIAKTSGRIPNDLHYFFWNISRNCCRRDETHCHACGQHPGLPERYQQLSPERCVFASVCQSASLATKLSDHVVDTDLY